MIRQMTSIPHKRMIKNSLAGSLVMLIALLLSGCLAQSAQPEPEPIYHHRIAAMTLSEQPSYSIPRRFTGIITARQRADLGFEFSGQLIAIHTDEGERVARGAVLAELDTALLEREREQLHAQVYEAQAQLELIQKNLNRVNSLQQKGYASEQQNDELTSQRKALKATLQRLDAALAANATRLEKSRLIAPFDAIVSRRLVDTGTIVNPATPVLRLLQTGPMEARIGLPLRVLDSVAVDDIVTLNYRDRNRDGRILAINPDLDPATRTVSVRIALATDPALVDGALIDLLLPETLQTQGFWVPLNALTDGLRGLWQVYVLDPADAPQRFRIAARSVQLEYADSEQAFITGALSDGESIVEAGLHRLVPGQIVRLTADLAQR